MSLVHANSDQNISIAIDTGGTFTDVSLVDRLTGEEWKAKVSSTPDDPSRGFIDGIKSVLQRSGVSPRQVSHVFHGTTVATNAILEMRGAKCAMLTTAGFKHVMEIGRHDIPRSANMFSWVKPDRPIPPQRIYEILQRTGFDGEEIEKLSEEQVRQVAQVIKAKNIKSIAICFLHSYANPDHEVRAREIVLEEIPDAQVSLSSEVLPKFREFERSITTALNAYVMPLVSHYVSRLKRRLKEEQIESAHLLLVKSNGGVTGADTIQKGPVHTALSGPAAGVIGAQHTGGLSGESRLITLDIGGTSADICLIDGDEPTITSEGSVGGWPVHLPMLAIHTIGAGGGSIARISEGGLVVGPVSAGAVPGPACYGRGGTEPTVTDAHLVLGHLPQHLLQGSMSLDLDAANRAVEQVAHRIGASIHDTAAGIIGIVNNNMIGAIRVVSVERGYDPKDFALLPFGGAGPLHGGFIARQLGMKSIIIGQGCGVLSSKGLLIADLKSDFSRTMLLRPPYEDLSSLGAAFDELQMGARQWLAEEGICTDGRQIRRFVSLRYENQGYELDVAWDSEDVSLAALHDVFEAFHNDHRRLYSFDQKDAPIELTGVRINAVGKLAKPRPYKHELTSSLDDARVGEQKIYFDGNWQDSAVYNRDLLPIGAAITGPAIIEQMDATTLVLPRQTCRIDAVGNMVINEQ